MSKIFTIEEEAKRERDAKTTVRPYQALRRGRSKETNENEIRQKEEGKREREIFMMGYMERDSECVCVQEREREKRTDRLKLANNKRNVTIYC